MKVNLKKVKLEEIAEIVSGGTPSTAESEFWNGEIPWITPKDLSGYNKKRIIRGERNISELGLRNSSARILPKNTILFTSRAPIGYVAIADTEVTTNQGFKSLILKDGNDPDFFYYLLKNNKDKIESFASGSTFKEISASVLRQLEFEIPSYEDQIKISKILNSLDDKIELNNQTNETLEAMARAIFKEWFIDFGPVRAKAEGRRPFGMDDETAALFPDSFEESELGMIPKGWRVEKIESEISVKDGTHDSPKPALTGYSLITTRHMSKSGLNFEDAYLISPEDFHEINKRSKVDPGDVLISMIGTVGLTHLVSINEKNFAIKNIGLFKTSLKPESYLYFYNFINSAYTVEFIRRCLSGSTQQYISLTALRNLPIILPPQKLQERFTTFAKSYYDLIAQNQNEIKSLNSIKNLLLPKLISGEMLL